MYQVNFGRLRVRLLQILLEMTRSILESMKYTMMRMVVKIIVVELKLLKEILELERVSVILSLLPKLLQRERTKLSIKLK